MRSISPFIVCVLPLPVWPYAKTTPTYIAHRTSHATRHAPRALRSMGCDDVPAVEDATYRARGRAPHERSADRGVDVVV